MTLGWTVDALVARARGGGALRMGLTRIEEAAWRRTDVDRAARAAAFDAHPYAMIVLPEGQHAAAEAARLIGDHDDLGTAARDCWEDLCLVATLPGEPPRLVAGAVGFPTDWRLEEKIGRSIADVHAPIHGYAGAFAAGVDNFLTQLGDGAIFGRANWFVVPSGEGRYLPDDAPATRFAHVTESNAGETLFIRCERQTLRRLPASGAVLFAIGVYTAPLDALADETIARVAAATSAIGAGEHERRAAPHYGPALAAYAAARARR